MIMQTLFFKKLESCITFLLVPIIFCVIIFIFYFIITMVSPLPVAVVNNSTIRQRKQSQPSRLNITAISPIDYTNQYYKLKRLYNILLASYERNMDELESQKTKNVDNIFLYEQKLSELSDELEDLRIKMDSSEYHVRILRTQLIYKKKIEILRMKDYEAIVAELEKLKPNVPVVGKVTNCNMDNTLIPLCKICYIKDVDTHLACGHVLCRSCFKGVVINFDTKKDPDNEEDNFEFYIRHYKLPTCPFCRTDIIAERVEPIYFS